jgi:hypothetical protein
VHLRRLAQRGCVGHPLLEPFMVYVLRSVHADTIRPRVAATIRDRCRAPDPA